MKALLVVILTTILLPISAYAEKYTCANLDYSATAEISEYYAGVILFRHLKRFQIEGETIYKGLIGKLDKGEPFMVNNVIVDMFSAGMTLEDSDGQRYELYCGAPENYDPESTEHAEFVGGWNYIFNFQD